MITNEMNEKLKSLMNVIDLQHYDGVTFVAESTNFNDKTRQITVELKIMPVQILDDNEIMLELLNFIKWMHAQTDLFWFIENKINLCFAYKFCVMGFGTQNESDYPVFLLYLQ